MTSAPRRPEATRTRGPGNGPRPSIPHRAGVPIVRDACRKVVQAIAGAGVLLALASSAVAAVSPVEQVRPWIGSNNGRWFHVRSASRPYGMITLSPDTDLSSRYARAGYVYDSKNVLGFSHLHGWLLAGLSVMPVTGEVSLEGPAAWQSPFQHEGETMLPGYHRLTLDRYDIDVELTATQRVGFHRWTYPKEKSAALILDFKTDLLEGKPVRAWMEKVSDHGLEGHFDVRKGHRQTFHEYRVFFALHFDVPIASLTAQPRRKPTAGDAIEGPGWVGLVRFAATLPTRRVQMKAAVSFTSLAEARKNMEAECPGWDFDRIKSEAIAEWNRDLSRIEVRGGTAAQRMKFYTDMHHVLNGRSAVCDASGSFPNRMDETTFKVERTPVVNGRPKHRMFNSDAMWWTCWNLNLIWGLAYPDYYEEMVNAWLAWSKVDPRGRLPYGTIAGRHSWVMWGAQATPLIARAIQMGLPGFDHEEAYATMRRMHLHPPEEGGNMHAVGEYSQLGYVPYEADVHSASLTLEHAWCDWVLAQVARRLGKPEDYAYFLKRSGNWRNGWDAGTGFMRPRMRDATWKPSFDPNVGLNVGFIEANAIQASFFVPHDVPGLAEVMGGAEKFIRRLDDLFRLSAPDRFSYRAPHGLGGNLNYGNQVCMHVAHMFTAAGKPWLTQHWAREVYNRTFSHIDADGGYAWDDEDQGQLGGLSALLAMGLFSLDGGTALEPRYELTASVFDEVIIRLDPAYNKGTTFVIRTVNNSPENRYIQSARLNGKKLDRCWIAHREISAGGVLEVAVGPTANEGWGNEGPRN